MSGSNLQVLNLLLERAASERDQRLAALQTATALSQAARNQQGQLTDYRQAYQQRWTQSFSASTTSMNILGCYQSFGQRLDQAVTSQQHATQHADARVEQARKALAEAELRVASVRLLIERRQAEARRASERQQQRADDEFAARVHARRETAQIITG